MQTSPFKKKKKTHSERLRFTFSSTLTPERSTTASSLLWGNRCSLSCILKSNRRLKKTEMETIMHSDSSESLCQPISHHFHTFDDFAFKYATKQKRKTSCCVSPSRSDWQEEKIMSPIVFSHRLCCYIIFFYNYISSSGRFIQRDL